MLLASQEVEHRELELRALARTNASLEVRVTKLEHEVALQEIRLQGHLARLHADILMDLLKGTAILLISALVVVALVT